MKRALLVSLGLVLMAGSAQAALIGVTLEEPLVSYNSGGTTAYDSASDLFVVDATTFGILVGGVPSPILAGSFDINITVDDSGALTGGTAGDDLLMMGDAIGLGLSGVLLTGEVVAFGFEEQGLSDGFDFLFAVTGGELVSNGYITTALAGVQLTSENSSFGGNFNVDFGGEAKGTVGGVIPEPNGARLMVVGVLLVGLAGTARQVFAH